MRGSNGDDGRKMTGEEEERALVALGGMKAVGVEVGVG